MRCSGLEPARRLEDRDSASRFHDSERKVFSQGGEDGIIEHIFSVIGTTNRHCVEFGVGNGLENNTRKLVELDGWSGHWFSLEPESEVKVPWRDRVRYMREQITAENVERVFESAGVPREFDLLSIDVDGNDFWIWQAIKNYRARVVVIEYNGTIPPPRSVAVQYHPESRWSGSCYFGASLSALDKLARSAGYALQYCDRLGTNAFFVSSEYGDPRPVADVWVPQKNTFPDDSRAWVDV